MMKDRIEIQDSGKRGCKVIVTGSFDRSWKEWLDADDFQTERTDGEKMMTAIHIKIRDQSDLRGLLIKLWDLNQEIISVYLEPGNSLCKSSSKKE